MSILRTNLDRKSFDSEDQIPNDLAVSATLTKAVEQACLLTRADGAAIALRDRENVFCRARTGLAPAVGSRLPSEPGITRACIETGKAVLCEDSEQDPRVRPSMARDLHLRSTVAVPILAQDSVLGAILVFSSLPFAFGCTDIAALQSIADHLAFIFDPDCAQKALSLKRNPRLVLVPARDPEHQSEAPQLRSSTIREEKSALATSPAKTAAGRGWLAAATACSLLLVLSFFANSHWSATKPSSSNRGPTPSSLETLGDRGGSRVEKPVGKYANGSSPVEHSFAGGTGAVVWVYPSSSTVSAVSKSGDEKADRVAISATSPALLIAGAPQGAQILVDDQWKASIDSNGEAKLSTLAPGPHRLRLALNGYLDYEQDVQLQTGQVSTITAKLEPLEPPILTTSATPPSFLLSPAVPPPVRLREPPAPDFVPDRSLKGHSGWVTGVAFSVDGQRLASGSWDQTVKLWDVLTGNQLSTIASKTKGVQAVAFSPDGHWLATEDSTNVVTLWDATTGRQTRVLPAHKPLGVLGSNWVYSIAFSPDGHWLGSGVDDKTVRVWDVQTGRPVRDLVSSRRSVIYIAFSPDGRWLASGDGDRTIGIWDVSSGQEIKRLSGHKKPIYAVAFSPDGRWVASASADRSVKLWDLATGREVRDLTGHGNLVTSLAFSPHGRWLASGSWDSNIKIWDVATGNEVQTLTGHTPIYSIAFDSRGRWLASGREDGTIELWRLREAMDQSSLR